LDDDIAGRRIGGVPSALLTYIGPYGIIDPATVKLAVLPGVIGGISVSVFDMDVDKVADALQNHAVVTNMFRQLDRLGMDTCNKLRVPHYAVAVELCSRTFKDEKLLRVHGHLWLALKGHTLQLHEMALAADALPYVNHKALTYMGAGTQRSNASHLAGNFYCSVKKVGTILQKTTIEPWVDYPVRDTWVTSLFAAGKVSGPVAREAYLRCVSRAQYNVAQLDMVLRERRKADQACRVLENEVKLRSTTNPWRNYPTIDAWKIQYREFKGRYLFFGPRRPQLHWKDSVFFEHVSAWAGTLL
jgi:hypothetical protein